MMSKSDTIAEIMRHNPTVREAFLAEFDTDELREYLQRLTSLTGSRRSAPAMESFHGSANPLVAATASG